MVEVSFTQTRAKQYKSRDVIEAYFGQGLSTSFVAPTVMERSRSVKVIPSSILFFSKRGKFKVLSDQE